MTWRNLFPDLFSDLDLAPPVAALNPSQKCVCSPEPPGHDEPVEPSAPVSLPATDQSGFSVGQLATIMALIQSSLTPPALFSRYSAPALLGFGPSATDSPSLWAVGRSAFSIFVSATWSFLGFRPSSRRGNRGARVGSFVQLGGGRRGHSACGPLPP